MNGSNRPKKLLLCGESNLDLGDKRSLGNGKTLQSHSRALSSEPPALGSAQVPDHPLRSQLLRHFHVRSRRQPHLLGVQGRPKGSLGSLHVMSLSFGPEWV